MGEETEKESRERDIQVRDNYVILLSRFGPYLWYLQIVYGSSSTGLLTSELNIIGY